MIGLQKHFKVFNLSLKLFSHIRVPYQLPAGHTFYNGALRVYVALLLNCGLRGLKGLVGGQNQTVGI